MLEIIATFSLVIMAVGVLVDGYYLGKHHDRIKKLEEKLKALESED